MLGLCYMEKGDYQNAIAEMQVAQTMADRQGRPDSDRISMCYDLGLAFQGAGNGGNALKEFQKVYAIDPSYRDAADKIKELQEGSNISLAQLKNDIEKEISSKFLEEGERIEREEKTKKNERVPR
jgi:tetratricopeptide (TPR) repeat protein